jgi:hypothetical protein
MKRFKHNQKGLAHVELGIFLALILVVGGIGFGVYKNHKNNEQQPVAKTSTVTKKATQSDYLANAPKNIKPITEQQCAGKPYAPTYQATTENLLFDIPQGQVLIDVHCDPNPKNAANDDISIQSAQANYFIFRQDPLLKETSGPTETRTVYSVEKVDIPKFSSLKLVKVGYKQKNGNVYYIEALTDQEITVGQAELSGGGPQLTFDGLGKTPEGLKHVYQMATYPPANYKTKTDYHTTFFNSPDVKNFEASMKSLRAQ